MTNLNLSRTLLAVACLAPWAGSYVLHLGGSSRAAIAGWLVLSCLHAGWRIAEHLVNFRRI